MWNETANSSEFYGTDLLEAHIRFDQPISHELEYIENDVTRFFLTLESNGQFISRLSANKVLNELMTEAKDFRNGKFRFPICKMPDALTPNYHAAFAAAMAEMPAGTHEIKAIFETDNPLQKGKVLAEGSFSFILSDADRDYLRSVAAENNAKGADQEEDVEAKAAFYQNLGKPAEKHELVNVTLANKSSGEICVMAGYNSGTKYIVGYQASLQVSIPSGTELYRYDEQQGCSTNFGTVGSKEAALTMEVY